MFPEISVPLRGGSICVLLALAVAVSLPGLCFHAHPPWHFLGRQAKGKDKTHSWGRLAPHGVSGFPPFFKAVTMFKSWIHVLDVDKPSTLLVSNRFGTKQAWNV